MPEGPPWLSRMVAGPGIRLAGRRFLSGETWREALAAAATLHQQGRTSAYLPLYPPALSEAEAWDRAGLFEELLRASAAQGASPDLVVDLGLLGWHVSTRLAKRLTTDLCRAAAECGGFIHVCVGFPADWERVADVVARVLADDGASGGLGMTVHFADAPALLRRLGPRSVNLLLHDHPRTLDERGAAAAAAATGKGGGGEAAAEGGPQGPRSGGGTAAGNERSAAPQPLRDRRAVRARFLELARELWDHDGYLTTLTRDAVLLESVVQTAHHLGVPETRYEFLFRQGDRHRLAREFAAQGRAVRTLLPFGPAWLDYLTARLEEWP